MIASQPEIVASLFKIAPNVIGMVLLKRLAVFEDGCESFLVLCLRYRSCHLADDHQKRQSCRFEDQERLRCMPC